MTSTHATTTRAVFISAHSPLVFRSGRPFGAEDDGGGGAAYGFPSSTSVAGALRAAWCDATGHVHQPQDRLLHQLVVRGGLRCTWHAAHGGELWLPRPANALARDHHKRWQWVAANPEPAGNAANAGGCDLPYSLRPVLPAEPSDYVNHADWWRQSAVESWLAEPRPTCAAFSPYDLLPPPPTDTRTHVSISAHNNQAKPGGLFASTGLDFSTDAAKAADQEQGLLCWVDGPASVMDRLEQLHLRHGRLGAEGRSAAYRLGSVEPGAAALPLPNCPTELAEELDAVEENQTLRLMLATPACYLRNGWFPDGLRPQRDGDRGEVIRGSMVGLPDWRFELVAAAVGRFQSSSGALMRNEQGARAFVPRPLHRLVPAGSMYWLKVLQRGETPLSSRWWQSTCYAEYARDGHGLGLWGLA